MEILFFLCFHPQKIDMATVYPAYEFSILQEVFVRISSLAMYQAWELFLLDC